MLSTTHGLRWCAPSARPTAYFRSRLRSNDPTCSLTGTRGRFALRRVGGGIACAAPNVERAVAAAVDVAVDVGPSRYRGMEVRMTGQRFG